ncbi:MAG: hypothetical protein IIB31_02640 [Chloroflexi bacterium]|nr:hypothetical protein [Chloroflexota bacterium]
MSTPDLKLIAQNELNKRELIENAPRPSMRSIETGITGLEVFGGVVSGEFADHNSDWLDRGRFDIVDRMRKGDSTVAATLMAMTLPILSTDIHIEARKQASDDQAPAIVQEAADFIHDQLFDSFACYINWNQWLREAMLYQAYGHYLFHPVWHTIPKGQWEGMIGLKRLSPRHPRSITAWNFNRHGRVIGITQEGFRPDDSPEHHKIRISVDKLMILTNQMEAGNPLGISVLRAAYKHWKYKDGFYAVQAIAVERQGAGTPYVQYPEGTKDPQLDKAEQMLQNLQAHEQSYVMFGADWDVGFLDMGGSSTLNPQTAIEHHDALISKASLAQFIQLAQGDRGSFALSEDNTRFFNFALQGVATYLADKWNTDIIPKLIKWNFGEIPHIPHLRFDRIGHIGLKDLVDGIGKLGEKGMLMNDHDLENHVRGIMNLPTISLKAFLSFRKLADCRIQAVFTPLVFAG